MDFLPPVYIAGPFGDPDPIRVAFNVQRAMFLGRLAALEGKAPLVVHPMIHGGIYGDDNDPAARSHGTACSMALLRTIMLTSHGRLWVLHDDDGNLSPGTKAEVAAWLRYRKGDRALRRGTWETWGHLARRHSLGSAHEMLSKPITPGQLLKAMQAAGVAP